MTTFEERIRDRYATNGTPPPTAGYRFAASRIDWATFWEVTHDADDWLVEPILAKGRGHALYAPAKAGKSLLVLYVAACLATGRPIFDRPAGDPRVVSYLDLEMTADDIRDRLLDMGFGPDVDMSRFHYHSMPSLSALDTASGGHEVEEMAMDLKAELVVVDTVGRAVAGDENEADTMQQFFRYTGGPLKARGIACTRVDHAGKDPAKGQRGSSAKNDDVDVVWHLTPRDAGAFDLRATHRRMGWIPEELHLQLQEDPLSYDIVREGGYPSGTAELVAKLDRIGVRDDEGQRWTRQIMREHGIKAGQAVLVAAIRFRRQRYNDPTNLA